MRCGTECDWVLDGRLDADEETQVLPIPRSRTQYSAWTLAGSLLDFTPQAECAVFRNGVSSTGLLGSVVARVAVEHLRIPDDGTTVETVIVLFFQSLQDLRAVVLC